VNEYKLHRCHNVCTITDGICCNLVKFYLHCVRPHVCWFHKQSESVWHNWMVGAWNSFAWVVPWAAQGKRWLSCILYILICSVCSKSCSDFQHSYCNMSDILLSHKTVSSMKTAVFWDVMPWSVNNCYQCFRETYYFNLLCPENEGSLFLQNTYQTRWSHMTEDSIFIVNTMKTSNLSSSSVHIGIITIRKVYKLMSVLNFLPLCSYLMYWCNICLSWPLTF
jgi:hypothetical protein